MNCEEEQQDQGDDGGDDGKISTNTFYIFFNRIFSPYFFCHI